MMRRDGGTTRRRNTGPRGPSRLSLCAALLLASRVVAGDSFHERIDRHIEARADGPLASRSTDAEFIRRVYLDLSGVIPTAVKAREFLADAAPEKRTRLVDQLLSSYSFASHLAEVLSVWLLDRRAEASVPSAEWRQFLRDSIAADTPWDRLVREIISADGRESSTRAAIKFFLVSGRGDHHQLSQDVARIFLGRNVLCSRCHDHPSVDAYKQSDYYGLYAYLAQGFAHKNTRTGQTYYLERPPKGEVEYESVFFEEKHSTGPRLPGSAAIAVPEFTKGDEFDEPAQDGFPGRPKFRPRGLLARDLTDAKNTAFVRNSVNRIWWLVMGRGLVHPIDALHAANPPSHPELLDALAGGFVARRFSLKWLLREICLSDAYGRSSRVPDGVAPEAVAPESYRVASLRPLSPEQMARSFLLATGNLEAVRNAPAPENQFVFKDYVDGRSAEPPSNLRDVLTFFVAVFGNPPGEPEVGFNASTEQALFLMNERFIASWLEPRDGNLISDLTKLDGADAIAEELWLRVLTRWPEPEEVALVKELLDGSDPRATILRDLAWSLLMGAEFRLNH